MYLQLVRLEREISWHKFTFYLLLEHSYTIIIMRGSNYTLIADETRT